MRQSSHRVSLFTLAMLPSALCGQDQKPLDGRAFVPPEPRSEIAADFKAMRDTGVWDGITVSIAGTFLPMVESELGFRLEHVDRLRVYLHDREHDPSNNDTGITILEGSDQLVIPPAEEGAHTETIAGLDVLVCRTWNADAEPSWWVAPKPGVLVYGARHLVEPALRRARVPGVTPPELLSLSAGRGVLAHLVLELDPTAKRGLIDSLDGKDLPEPDFMMLRLRTESSDDGEDPRVHVDGKLRWATPENGPPQLLAHLQQRLALLEKHPRLGALKRIWKLMELGVDGRDLTLHMDLGRPRDVGGLIAIAAPIFMLGTSVAPAAAAVPAESVPVQVEEPPPPPVPEPAPKDGGKGKDG